MDDHWRRAIAVGFLSAITLYLVAPQPESRTGNGRRQWKSPGDPKAAHGNGTGELEPDVIEVALRLRGRD